MAKYTKTILDLLEENERLEDAIDKISDRIVSELYLLDASSNKQEKRHLESVIEMLRKNKVELEAERESNKQNLRRALLKLFE
jgi:predicted  nucleic acid-binding Zn-ribbon protein